MKNLNEVRNFLDNEISFINAGGCVISALAMYRWLELNNQLKGDEFIAYGYFGDDYGWYYMNQEALNNSALKPSACAHAFLYHNGMYFDSNRKVNINNYSLLHYIHDFDFILKSINEPVWNNRFDRSQVFAIQQALEIDLSDIEIYF